MKYDFHFELGYFTLGFRKEGESVIAKKVNLLIQPPGWCKNELHYSKHEICTILEDSDDSEYLVNFLMIFFR